MCNLFAGYSITKNKNFNRISLEDPEKPAAKQRWTTLRMSKPLVCRQSFDTTAASALYQLSVNTILAIARYVAR